MPEPYGVSFITIFNCYFTFFCSRIDQGVFRISIPKVCVTADDPRLLRGKPFPDPFLLAAADLGIDPTRAVIFEDSPSGIKAAVAAGATVIAVCTSHQRHQIEHLDAHFVIDTMDQIKVVQGKDGQLEFTVTY